MKEISLEEIEERVKKRNQFKKLENVVYDTRSIYLSIRCDEYKWLIENVRILRK